MTNIKIVTKVVNALPTERPLVTGEVYKVKQPNGDILTYIVDSSGEPIFERGIDNEEQGRLDQLTQAQITKLIESYSKGEVDSKLVQTVSETIPVPNTVLPQNTDVPSWVTTNGKALLYGRAGGTTYTQIGGASVTVAEGFQRGAYYSKATNRWTFDDVDTPIPTAPADGIIIQGNNKATSGDTVFNALKPVNSVISPSKNIVNYLDFEPEIYVVSQSTNKIVITGGQLNWIGIKITSGFTVGKTYTPQGFGSLGGASTPWIIFADSTNTHISTILASSFAPFTIPPNTAIIYMRVANRSGIGNTPKNNEFTGTVMISEGTVQRPFEKYGQATVKASSVIEEYSPFYVTLTPVTTPYTGTLISQEVGKVYERMKDNFYIGYSILYQRLDYADYASGDFHGGKIVRFAGARLYTYDLSTGVFTDMNKVLIITPESEWVMNSGGWTGGYHGNEDYSKVHFIIDNKVYNPTGDVDFTPSGVIACKSFEYTQQSNLKLDVVDPITGLKISIGNRKKRVSFSKGYKVNSKFTPVLAGKSMSMYAGICCVGKYFTQVTSDSGTSFTPVGNEQFTIDNDYFGRKIYYNSPDVRLTFAASILEWSKEKGCFIRCWDRSSDTKSYFFLPSYTTVVGDWIESEMLIKIEM